MQVMMLLIAGYQWPHSKHIAWLLMLLQDVVCIDRRMFLLPRTLSSNILIGRRLNTNCTVDT